MPPLVSPDGLPATPAATPAATQVATALDRELAAAAADLTLAGPEAAPLLAGARRAVQGGKRLRARLCLAAHQACGGDDATASAGVAAALELFQAAALVHDDLMDHSDTRRGQPAAHRWFEQAAPAGDHRAEQFGAGAAVLLGDLLLTMSSTALERSCRELAPERRWKLADLFAAMSHEVAYGQYLDLLASHSAWRPEVDLDRAWRVIHAKTARYSVELPLAMGAVLAGADESALAWFATIGRDAGAAFQLRDDLLGVFGDPAITGKPAGDDLLEGKRTVLVALAHQRTDATTRSRLERDLGRRDLTEQELTDLRTALVDSGAVAEVERLITDTTARLDEALTNAPPAVVHPDVLAPLLRALVDREA